MKHRIPKDVQPKRKAKAQPQRAILSAAICFLLGMGTASAQAASAAEPHNVVELSASASIEMQQDWLTLTLVATKDGSDPAALQADVRRVLDGAVQLVKKTALSPAMELHTGAFSLQPRYNRDAVITGWTARTELVLEGSDFARISTAATSVKGMSISDMSFSLSKALRLKVGAEAQAQAIQNFRDKATDVAKRFGFAGYSLRQVAVGSDDPTAPRPYMRQAAQAKSMAFSDGPGVPIESGKSSVVVTVNGSIQLK